MIVFKGAVGVNGDLVVNPDNAIKVKNIDPIENKTYVQVGGDLYIDAGKQFSPTPSPCASHLVSGSMVIWMLAQTTYMLKT